MRMTGRNIFVSYRRGTDGNAASRLYRQLSQEFGRDAIFFDVDSIPVGVDFHDYLDQQVARCSAFIAVIGPSWTAAMPRLADPDDFVRIEIESALERQGIPVIPVLVDGAEMPRAEDLPPALAKLPKRNGVPVTPQYFDLIVREKLIPALADLGAVSAGPAGSEPEAQSVASVDTASAKPRKRRGWLFPAVVTLALLVAATVALLRQGDLWRGDPAAEGREKSSVPTLVSSDTIKTDDGNADRIAREVHANALPKGRTRICLTNETPSGWDKALRISGSEAVELYTRRGEESCKEVPSDQTVRLTLIKAKTFGVMTRVGTRPLDLNKHSGHKITLTWLSD